MATLKVVPFFDAKGAAANLNVTERKFRSWANGQLTKAEIAAGLTLSKFPKAAIKSGKQNWSNKLLTAWAKAHNAALVKLGYHCVITSTKTAKSANAGKAKKPNAAKTIKPKSLKQPVEKSSKKVEEFDLLKEIEREHGTVGGKRVKSTFIAELKLNDKYTLSPLGSEVKSISLDLGEAGTVQSGARALATLLSAVSIGVSVRSVKVAKAAKADEAMLHAWLADVAAVAGIHNSVLVEWEGSIGKVVIHRKLEIVKK